MASVLLLCTAENTPIRPFAREDYRRLLFAAERDRFRVHTCTDDPEKADVILFVGVGEDDFLDVRRHPFVSTYRDRCFLFDTSDRFIPFLPGVYASIEKHWYSQQRVRSGFYLRVFENNSIQFDPTRYETPYLFSFAGAMANAPVRQRLSRLQHSRGVILNTDSVTRRWLELSPDKQQAIRSRYCDLLAQSKFVLCPRGCGVSSWRLFETMKVGRVPVILSDQWVPPQGPDWASFALRVPEKNLARIPELLEHYEPQAREMGFRAREAFNSWFAEDTCFHRIVNWCLDIQARRTMSEWWASWPVLLQYLRPHHLRHFCLSRLRRSLGKLWRPGCLRP